MQILGALASLAVAASLQSLPQLSHDVSLCLSLCLSYKDTCHVGLGSILLRYGFILNNYICKTPISK